MQEEHVENHPDAEAESSVDTEANEAVVAEEASDAPEGSVAGPPPPKDDPGETDTKDEPDVAVETSDEVHSETAEADDLPPEADMTSAESTPEEAEHEIGEESAAEPTAAELSAESAQPTESADAETEVAEDEEVVEERPTVIQPPPDDGIKRRWYAVHAHSGQEANVQEALKVKAEQEGLAHLMTNVFVPMEDFTEYKSGEKKTSKRKFFPGYLLLQLPEHPEKHADLWHLIKDTPGVTGFIGSRNEPVPLEDSEVQALVEEIRGERERPKPKLDFEIGERVKINEGAFANFMGNIGEINEERGKLKVLIEIFERQTSVEVDFWQVEKI